MYKLTQIFILIKKKNIFEHQLSPNTNSIALSFTLFQKQAAAQKRALKAVRESLKDCVILFFKVFFILKYIKIIF